MSYRGKRDYGQSNLRRNSNSFGEVKRSKWGNRGGNAGGSPRNDMVDPPSLFKVPISPPQRGSPALNRNRGNFSQNGRGPTQPQQYFKMSDMPRFVEPEHAGRPWDGNFHARCKSWQDRHKLAYYRSRCLALEFENQMLFEQINSLMEENCTFAAERGEMPSMRLPEFLGRNKEPEAEESRFSNKKSTPNENQGKDKTSRETPSEIEFVIAEDMMELIEKSIRHKLTLKKHRKEEEHKNKTEKTIKSKEVKKEEEGPTYPVGKKRCDDLRLLYGENCDLIQKLETAAQLNFNRNCDTLKPELWMAAPLNPESIVV